MTAQDIAADEHVDVRTVYNDMNEAISSSSIEGWSNMVLSIS